MSRLALWYLYVLPSANRSRALGIPTDAVFVDMASGHALLAVRHNAGIFVPTYTSPSLILQSNMASWRRIMNPLNCPCLNHSLVLGLSVSATQGGIQLGSDGASTLTGGNVEHCLYSRGFFRT